MSKVKYAPMDLRESIGIKCTISCSSCSKEGVIYGSDDDEASYIFFEHGWRSTKKENVYCPECAKKKLKICLQKKI